ncbi:MAG TPA: hypothetical protein VJK52_03910 [Candidatus Nanoarchaeia archaeon]|nr:hypothetical protein [Candidatus Nanoarchaeia archaeon]
MHPYTRAIAGAMLAATLGCSQPREGQMYRSTELAPSAVPSGLTREIARLEQVIMGTMREQGVRNIGKDYAEYRFDIQVGDEQFYARSLHEFDKGVLISQAFILTVVKDDSAHYNRWYRDQGCNGITNDPNNWESRHDYGYDRTGDQLFDDQVLPVNKELVADLKAMVQAIAKNSN